MGDASPFPTSSSEMAPPPDAAITDYERRREENIRRNDAILASLRRKAAELSEATQLFSAKRVKKERRAISAAHTGSVVLRQSLRTRGLPPVAPADAASLPTPASPSPPMARSTRVSSSLASSILAASSPAPPEAKVSTYGFYPGKELVLKPEHVRRVVPDGAMPVQVLPLVDRTVVAVGNRLGYIGFWDVDGAVEEDYGVHGVFEYLPHRGIVGAIVAHPAAPHKIYSCSYGDGGEICFMDLEKETFNMMHLCDHSIFFLCQAPNSSSCLYFVEENILKLLDDRIGKVSARWDLHNSRINSIDFHPRNAHMLTTSSSDGTCRIWDTRTMENNKAECLKVLDHSRSVQSAYFSPSGLMVATTCLDSTVRIFSGDNFEKSHVKHLNHTSPIFRASWGWNDTHIFTGNTKRAVDIISVDPTYGILFTSNSSCLKSEYMTCAPCRFSVHPYRVGHLACSSHGGKVFLWTRA